MHQEPRSPLARPGPADAVRPIAVFLSFSGKGGVERMAVNLIQGLVDLGQCLDLVLVRDESPHLEQLPEGVNIVRLGARHTLSALPLLANYLRKRRPRALLAAKDRAGRVAVMARWLSRQDTRIVLRLGTHLSTAMQERSALARALRYLPIRLLYRHLDRIVAVSEGVAEDTARIAHLHRDHIEVIRNPAITDRLQTQARAPLAHPWFEPGQIPVILGAGRLTRQKDFPTLIRAFARVRRERPCRLAILGEGRDRRQLEALIAALDLSADVELPGFQPNPYAFMSRAALFVLSSAWEGSPNVLTEAMALGTPVLATDCPSGPRELLSDRRRGALVPVGDVESLARAMGDTLEAPPDAATLRSAVREYHQSFAARRYLDVLCPSN